MIHDRRKIREPRPPIGWREWIGLPDLGVEWVKVKVDTGARSSAIHASNMEIFSRGGHRWVRFDVHPIQRDTSIVVHAEARLADQRRVRDSGGKAEERLVIRTTMRFQGEEWPIELTLTKRDSMGFRMLLGREAVRGRFAVDPARSFIGGRGPTRTKKTRRKKAKGARRSDA